MAFTQNSPQSLLFCVGTFIPLAFYLEMFASGTLHLKPPHSGLLSCFVSAMLLCLAIQFYNYFTGNIQKKKLDEQRIANQANKEVNKHREELKRLEITERNEQRSTAAAATGLKLEHERTMNAQNNTFKLCESMLGKVRELDADKLIRAASILPGVVNGQVDSEILSTVLNQTEKKPESIGQSENIPALEQQAIKFEYYDNNFLRTKKI